MSSQVSSEQLIRVSLEVAYSINGSFKGFKLCDRSQSNKVFAFPKLVLKDHCLKCSSNFNIVVESFICDTETLKKTKIATDPEVNKTEIVSEEEFELQNDFVSVPETKVLPEAIEIKCEPLQPMDESSDDRDHSSPPAHSQSPIKDIIKSCHTQCATCLNWFRKDVFQKHVKSCKTRSVSPQKPSKVKLKKKSGRPKLEDTTAKKFMCHLCGCQFRFAGLYRQHMTSHDLNDPKPFKCDLCPSTFGNKNNIRTHMIQKHLPHEEKKFCCAFCPDKRFGQRSFLVTHMTQQHRLAKCDICLKTYCSSVYLKEHKMLVHSKAEDNRPKYPCDECNEVFKQMKYLRTHKTRNHKEKRFKCDQCAKEFSFPYAFRRHMAMHKNERPFVCSVCGNTYRTKTYLKSHLRLHTGDKPYECSVCQQKFSDSGCYRSHLVKHEKRMGITLDKSIKKFHVYG